MAKFGTLGEHIRGVATAAGISLASMTAATSATADQAMSALEQTIGVDLPSHFQGEAQALAFARQNGLELVKDFHHRYALVTPELAREQLLGRKNVQLSPNGMIILWEGFQGWLLTGDGDIHQIQVERTSGEKDDEEDDGSGGGGNGCGNPAGCN